jgi:hypothetical protein
VQGPGTTGVAARRFRLLAPAAALVLGGVLLVLVIADVPFAGLAHQGSGTRAYIGVGQPRRMRRAGRPLYRPAGPGVWSSTAFAGTVLAIPVRTDRASSGQTPIGHATRPHPLRMPAVMMVQAAGASRVPWSTVDSSRSPWRSRSARQASSFSGRIRRLSYRSCT